LQMTTGLVAAGPAGLSPAFAATKPPAATGVPGDFAFLGGRWKIKHQQMKSGAWDRFDGEATVYDILGGIGSVEELRIPSRGFSGMGLRLLDVERRLWADYWVNARNGVLEPPPSWGSFVDGVGIWDSEDNDGGQAIIVRGTWDQIKPTSCRWTQAVSRDNGGQWQENWVMHWTRA
jgi:hypothetical protein